MDSARFTRSAAGQCPPTPPVLRLITAVRLMAVGPGARRIWFAPDFPVGKALADPAGRRLLLASGGSLGEMALDLPPGDSVLSRTVTIPANLPRRPSPSSAAVVRSARVRPIRCG